MPSPYSFFSSALILATALTSGPGVAQSQTASQRSAKVSVDEGQIPGADGVRLFYRKLGNSPDVVVFLHGGPGLSMRDGGKSLEALGEQHTLILFDQRGGGRSELLQDKAVLTAQHSVRDLEALRQHFRIEKMALVGLSWGSGLAALYAEAHPERVSRIVFLDPMPVALNPYARERSAKIRTLFTTEEQARLRELHEQLRTAPDDQLQAICREEDRIFFKPYMVKPDNYARYRGDVCDDPPAAIRNSALVNSAVVSSLGDFDLRPVLARIRIPVLVVEGAETNVPLDGTREWARTPPDARLLLIPDAGHAAFLDQPEVLIREINAFLSGMWPAGATQLPTASSR